MNSDFASHPLDVLQRALEWQSEGHAFAIAFITSTEGGGVRDAGSIMAIRADGRFCGYLSGGCIDADIVAQAQSAVETNRSKQLRYGVGSPFVDLPLPCGGSIDIRIIPEPDVQTISEWKNALSMRADASISISASGEIQFGASEECAFTFSYRPKLRLRIAGRGADCLMLAQLSQDAGYDVCLQLPDEEDIRSAKSLGLTNVQHLKQVSALPETDDDAHTAFVLMFHDRHWEAPLLTQALNGPAFYVGAVGSQRTHDKRKIDLKLEGISEQQIDRIHAPIGLLPAARNSSTLAVSVLSEILSGFEASRPTPFDRSGALLLAAGASSRFEGGDKLLSRLGQKSVLANISDRLAAFPLRTRLMISAPHHSARRDEVSPAKWNHVQNTQAADGLSTSLRTGIQALGCDPDIDTILVCLGDMPLIPADHFRALYSAMTPDTEAVMTVSNGQLMPPALFARSTFAKLEALTGDEGAGKLFNSLINTETVPLDDRYARDIDTRSDLETSEVIHG